MRSHFHIDFHTIRLLFATSGVTTCWPLERVQVWVTSALASFFRHGASCLDKNLLYLMLSRILNWPWRWWWRWDDLTQHASTEMKKTATLNKNASNIGACIFCLCWDWVVWNSASCLHSMAFSSSSCWSSSAKPASSSWYFRSLGETCSTEEDF